MKEEGKKRTIETEGEGLLDSPLPLLQMDDWEHGSDGDKTGSSGNETGNNGNETENDVKKSYRETHREEKGSWREWEHGREERGGVCVKGGKEGTERNSGEKGKVHLSPSDFQQVELRMPPLLFSASFFFKIN